MFQHGVRSVLSRMGIFLVSFLAVYTVGWFILVFIGFTSLRFIEIYSMGISWRSFLLNKEVAFWLFIIGVIVAYQFVKKFRKGEL